MLASLLVFVLAPVTFYVILALVSDEYYRYALLNTHSLWLSPKPLFKRYSNRATD